MPIIPIRWISSYIKTVGGQKAYFMNLIKFNIPVLKVLLKAIIQDYK